MFNSTRIQEKRRPRGRRLAAMLGATLATVLASAAPALALPGLERRDGSSAIDSLPEKTATAYCPEGKRVVGGGGMIVWGFGQPQEREIVLKEMMPSHPLTGTDRYIVSAAETETGTAVDWGVEAYAMCADPPPGIRLEMEPGTYSSSTTKLVTPECDPGEKVLGTGGWVNAPGGQAALQVMRSSMTGDFAYVQAHEDPTGYGGGWSVFGWAICADEPAGYEIIQGRSAEEDSEGIKSALAQCDSDKQVHAGGGAVSFAAPGNAVLRDIIPDSYGIGRQVDADAMETTPTSADWDFFVAQAICAY